MKNIPIGATNKSVSMLNEKYFLSCDLKLIVLTVMLKLILIKTIFTFVNSKTVRKAVLAR